MILSGRILSNALSANVFDYAPAAQFTQGDQATVFIQLIDTTQDTMQQGFNPPGRRFMPAAGATLQVLLDCVDDAKKITRTLVQPFPQDPSIWRLDVLPTDKVKGTVTIRLVLNESGKETRGYIKAGMLVNPAAPE